MLWNFTKAELFRATKMKSFYILPIIMIISLVFTSFVYLRLDKSLFGFSEADINSMTSNGMTAENMSDSFMMGFEAGSSSTMEALEEESEPIKIIGEGLMWGEDIPTFFQLDIAGLDNLMFLAIFAGLFFGSVYSTGSDKNLIIGNSRKELMFASRLIVVLIYTFAFTLITFLGQALIVAMYGAPVKFNLDASVVKYFIYAWFLTFVFTTIVAAITTLTRSKAAGITLGIVLSMGILSLVLSIGDIIINNVFNVDSFSLSNYTVTNNLVMMNLTSDGAQVIRALVVGLIYLVLSVTVIVINNRKRDLC